MGNFLLLKWALPKRKGVFFLGFVPLIEPLLLAWYSFICLYWTNKRVLCRFLDTQQCCDSRHITSDLIV